MTYCQLSPEPPEAIRYVSPAEVTYEVTGVSAGANVPDEYGLGDTGGGKDWLVVMLLITNGSNESLSLDSDDFKISANGEEFDEDGLASGTLNIELDTKDMGNFLGTSVEPGDAEIFGMVFQAPFDARNYELVIKDEGDTSLNLNEHIQRCRKPDMLEPTPTIEPTAIDTPVPSPTPKISPTPRPTRVSPTQVPTRVSPTERPTVRLVVPAGTDAQTIEIMNNLERYQNTQVRIMGLVHIAGIVDGQTVFVITDEETYFFNVVYDGVLPNIAPGDIVIVEGVLLDRTLQGSPLVRAINVNEN